MAKGEIAKLTTKLEIIEIVLSIKFLKVRHSVIYHLYAEYN